ncbi:MAG: ATP-binding protein [Cyanobacteria bacterium P01_F01_bin.53]
MALDREAVTQIQNYAQRSASLLLYQSVLDSEVGQAFVSLLNALIESADTASEMSPAAVQCASAYGQWFSALANAKQSWQHHLVSQILAADNGFAQQVQRRAGGEHDLDPGILAAAQYDLATLYCLYQLSAEQLSKWTQQATAGDLPPTMQLAVEPTLPVQFPAEADWRGAITELAKVYATQGVGIFGQFKAFRWQGSSTVGQLVGIPSPDPIALKQLAAYEHPKQQLIQNTESLLKGYTAQNVLLYGSRGAGKSSLVKALLNEYADRGLRLIEVPKANLQNLPQIIEPLSHVPQKFIIFVDDLSFEEDDEAFKALKVVLEGGVTARPQNVVVYATSNRRHLIREFFDERPRPKDAEEIQAWDTVQEKLSFSDRFGLTLTFSPADQPTYLTIVRELAAQAGLNLEPENLDWRARQWATRHNGRSGRTARQFVDFLIAEQGE